MGGGYSSWRKKFTTSFGGRGPLNLRIINAVQTLQVDVGHSRYPISIGSGLLANRELLEARIRSRDLLIVTNTTVARLYLAKLTDTLASKRVAECILPDGEQHKTLQTAGWVFDALIAKKMNRDATVLALGGGVVGDIAGFAAACYQRGVGYLQGEAVGLGMLIAADVSHRLGLIDAVIQDRVREILRKAGLPTAAPRVGAAKALELMQMDKKVLAGTVRLVLLERLGRAIVTGDYSQAALDGAVAAHFA